MNAEKSKSCPMGPKSLIWKIEAQDHGLAFAEDGVAAVGNIRNGVGSCALCPMRSRNSVRQTGILSVIGNKRATISNVLKSAKARLRCGFIGKQVKNRLGSAHKKTGRLHGMISDV